MAFWAALFIPHRKNNALGVYYESLSVCLRMTPAC